MRNRTLVCPLRSGSSGNAVLIAADSTRILVDSGVACRTIEQAMLSIGEDAASLDALLVTHEHADHIASVGAMMRRYKLPLYVNEPTWLAMRSGLGNIDEDLVHLIREDKAFTIGSMSVTSFATPHDAVSPVGYRVESGHGAVTLLTDIGEMDEHLLQQASGSRVVLIEANYDPVMLMAGPYPAQLKQRVSSSVGHLSNQDCAHAVGSLLETGTEQFVLSHLSKENNYPELALLTVGRYLNSLAARPGRDARISVARRFAVSDPLCL